MRFLLLFIILAAFGTSKHARAEENPSEYTSRLVKELRGYMDMEDGAEKKNSFCKIFANNVDVVNLAIEAIDQSNKWKNAEQSKKNAAMDAFPSYLVNSYYGKLKLSLPLLGDVSSNYKEEGGIIYVDATTVLNLIPVQFQYQKQDGKLFLVDIVVQGLSLKKSLKDEINGPSDINVLAAGMKKVSNNNLGECEKNLFTGMTQINSEVKKSTTVSAGNGSNPSVSGSAEKKKVANATSDKEKTNKESLVPVVQSAD